MYTSTGKSILLVSLIGFVIADVVTMFSSCEATPSPSHAGGAIALFLQLCAIAAVAFWMQYFQLTYRPPRPTTDMNRLKLIALPLVFCFMSIGLFRQSVLFSDTLNQGRGATSVGAACFQ